MLRMSLIGKKYLLIVWHLQKHLFPHTKLQLCVVAKQPLNPGMVGILIRINYPPNHPHLLGVQPIVSSPISQPKRGCTTFLINPHLQFCVAKACFIKLSFCSISIPKFFHCLPEFDVPQFSASDGFTVQSNQSGPLLTTGTCGVGSLCSPLDGIIVGE